MALFQRFRTRYVESVPEGEDWPPPGPRSVGDLLRQRREGLGFDLGEVAAALRIKPAYLLALEEGAPDRLPGPAYAIGFLRAYGDHLGLDSEEILRQFKAVSAGLDTRPDLSFPMPLGEASIPGGAMLLVAVILALCGYGTWYYLSTAERSRPERVTAVPAALLPPSGAAAPAAGDAAPAAERESAPPGGEMTPKLVPGLALAATPQPAPAAATGLATSPPDATAPPPAPLSGGAAAALAAAQPPPAAANAAAPAAVNATPPAAAVASATPPPGSPKREPPQAYGAADKPSHVAIIATADSWVQVRDPDGSPLFSRVLKPGESYRVPDRPGLTLRTGNAGGLDITVDGKAVPAIGHSGEIRHSVNLDPQALMSGTAAQQ